MTDREHIIRSLVADPVLAHATFFRDNHSNTTPQFHKTIISDWHSPTQNVIDLAFRGAGKSTLAEEAITIRASLGEPNIVIIGESWDRAVDRLRTIKHHIETNSFIQATLGVEPGNLWQEDKIVLNNGSIVQSFGRGQSLRGVKYINERPSLVFYDDLEDEESVASPQARAKTLTWYTSTAIPALGRPTPRQRMAATPLHPEALAVKLSQNSQWLTRIYPVIYQADDGSGWRATWPERFSVEWALDMWEHYRSLGKEEAFVQEYLCQASDPASQTFTDTMFRVVPRSRSWHSVYAIYDPARTTNTQSATTGKVVCSWIGNKLVVWEASARKLMPDQIIADIFETDEKYSPVLIGFEKNGLDEWALQPLRTAQVQKGVILPLRPLLAPKNKIDFIRGLQPYFKAGEVEFTQDFPELRQQLVGFPTGHIDAPNALAYMLKLRLGVPYYDGLNDEHVVGKVNLLKHNPVYVSLNTDGKVTTAQLTQYSSRRLIIIRDWLIEEDAGLALQEINKDIKVEVDKQITVRWFSPRLHFQDYSVIGLKAAASKARINISRGGDPLVGREEIRGLMRRYTRDMPAFVIGSQAKWTLRAMAGGFCRDDRTQLPVDGAYSVLMEGLESLVGLMRGPENQDDNDVQYAYTGDGRRYISALAR